MGPILDILAYRIHGPYLGGSFSEHPRRPARKAVIKSAASAASPEGFPSRDQVGR